MKIRRAQMEALDEAARADFHRRLRAFLKQELPEQTAEIGDEALDRRITDGERRAAKYSIFSEAGVAQFLCLGFLAGPDFDERPAIQAYLKEPGEDPEVRLGELVDYIAQLDAEKG